MNPGVARSDDRDGDHPDTDLPSGDRVPAVVRDRLVHEFAPLGSALPIGVLGAVGMGTVVYANDAAVKDLGRPESELVGRGWETTIHAGDRPELVSAIALVLDSGARQRVVVRLAHDTDRWMELTIVGLGQRNQPTGWLATIDDVTERVRSQRRLAHEATHDPLTRLPNRTLLTDRLQVAGRRLPREAPGTAVAVLFLDLDDFKDVNDRYGHASGDVVLVETARRLTRVTRAGDTIARFGGDEFVVVAELADRDEVPRLLERIHAALSEPIEVIGGTVTMRTSIGVALAVGSLPSVEDMLDLADREMYQHKSAHKSAGHI